MDITSTEINSTSTPTIQYRYQFTFRQNSYGAWYANEKRVGFGTEVFVKTEDFSGGINADLYTYRDDNNMTNKHYNYSPFELKAYARIQLGGERLILYTSFHFKQRTPGTIL